MPLERHLFIHATSDYQAPTPPQATILDDGDKFSQTIKTSNHFKKEKKTHYIHMGRLRGKNKDKKQHVMKNQQQEKANNLEFYTHGL